jgi:hypothetical protein
VGDPPWIRPEPYTFERIPALKPVTCHDVEGEQPCWLHDDGRQHRRFHALAASLERRFGREVGLFDVLRTLRGRVPQRDLLWLASRPIWYVKPDRVLSWVALDAAWVAFGNLNQTPQKRDAWCRLRRRIVGLTSAPWRLAYRFDHDGPEHPALWLFSKPCSGSERLDEVGAGSRFDYVRLALSRALKWEI